MSLAASSSAELDEAAAEYRQARDELERARITFEAVREKFSGIRRWASQALGWRIWMEWQATHRDLRFAGGPIGQGIQMVLETHAYEEAQRYCAGHAKKFDPTLTLKAIVDTLRRSGFEFTSSTPLREVNAALIRLDGVEKLTSGVYQSKNSADAINFMRHAGAEVRREEGDARRGNRPAVVRAGTHTSAQTAERETEERQP